MKSERHISNQGPKAGTRWFRAASNGRGFVTKHSAETRHVLDRTLGGDVIYVSGRRSRFEYRSRCTILAWLDWEEDARKIANGR